MPGVSKSLIDRYGNSGSTGPSLTSFAMGGEAPIRDGGVCSTHLMECQVSAAKMGEMSTWCPSGVQVINSVVMEGVRVGDGAHIQGSILCAGVTMEPHASLRDCQVPPPLPLFLSLLLP